MYDMVRYCGRDEGQGAHVDDLRFRPARRNVQLLLTTRLVSEARVQRAVHVSAESAQSSAPLRAVSAFHRVGALRLAGGAVAV